MRAPGLAAWLRRVAPSRARGAVAIALVTNSGIRALNREFRGKDAATDVLSFPTRVGPHLHAPRARRRGFAAFPSGASRGPQALPPGDPHLGDIAIATGVAQRQARSAGHSYAAELKVLALHGLLHLLGYDHDDPSDRRRMARLERRLRSKGGLAAGLIERHS